MKKDIQDKILVYVTGWVKFESKQIQELLWDYKSFYKSLKNSAVVKFCCD